MTEYDNINRGAAWPNRNKKEDWQPEYTGSLDVDGVLYWLDVWVVFEPQGNRPPIKIKIRRKNDQLAEDKPVRTPEGAVKGLQHLKEALGKSISQGEYKPGADDDIPY